MINASTSHSTATVLLLSCGSSAICSMVRLSLPSRCASRAIFSINKMKPAAAVSSSTPSSLLRVPSINTKPHNTVTANISGSSRRSISERAASG